jgi:AcrR family transcriptional regulator
MTRRAEKSLETRTRILDAAEEQFSKRGVDGVTLRDIAQIAEVDTALLHYYFDSKQGIFDAVLARRAAILRYETTEPFPIRARRFRHSNRRWRGLGLPATDFPSGPDRRQGMAKLLFDRSSARK